MCKEEIEKACKRCRLPTEYCKGCSLRKLEQKYGKKTVLH